MCNQTNCKHFAPPQITIYTPSWINISMFQHVNYYYLYCYYCYFFYSHTHNNYDWQYASICQIVYVMSKCKRFYLRIQKKPKDGVTDRMWLYEDIDRDLYFIVYSQSSKNWNKYILNGKTRSNNNQPLGFYAIPHFLPKHFLTLSLRCGHLIWSLVLILQSCRGYVNFWGNYFTH